MSRLSLPIRMWFTFLRMIRGWFTDIPSWSGRDGIRIRESGLAGLISRSELALELDGGAVSDGDGVTGDSTGITIMRGLTAGGTTPGAGRFITGARTHEADSHEVVVSTVPAEPGLLMETGRRRGDTLHRAGRAGCGRALSAATTEAEKPTASRRAAGPALVAAAASMAAEATEAAGVGNR